MILPVVILGVCAHVVVPAEFLMSIKYTTNKNKICPKC